MKTAFETRMIFQGIPFMVTLDEDQSRSPQVRLGIKIQRPYRMSEANGSLAIDLYMLLTLHAEKFGEVAGWRTCAEAKQRIAKAVYETRAKGVCWNASWYQVALL